MSIPTSFTQSQLTAMETAYASGVTTVSHNGKTVSYRNLQEMERIMATIRSALGVTNETNMPTVHFAEFREVGDEG